MTHLSLTKQKCPNFGGPLQKDSGDKLLILLYCSYYCTCPCVSRQDFKWMHTCHDPWLAASHLLGVLGLQILTTASGSVIQAQGLSSCYLPYRPVFTQQASHQAGDAPVQGSIGNCLLSSVLMETFLYPPEFRIFRGKKKEMFGILEIAVQGIQVDIVPGQY